VEEGKRGRKKESGFWVFVKHLGMGFGDGEKQNEKAIMESKKGPTKTRRKRKRGEQCSMRSGRRRRRR
jgi:hypothetical protein